MKPAFIQRYLNDPDPIMRHFARQGGRRLFSKTWFRSFILTSLIFSAYFVVSYLLGLPFGSESDVIILMGLTLVIIGTSLVVPALVGTLVSYTLANLGENQFLQDMKLTLISHRRIFHYLYHGSMRRLLPLVYAIQLPLLACWMYSMVMIITSGKYLTLEDIMDEIMMPMLLGTFLEVVLLRTWFDAHAANMAGWHYTLTGRSRFNAGLRAFGACFGEVLITIFSCYLLVYFFEGLFRMDEDSGSFLFLGINMGVCLFWIVRSARMHPLSRRLGLRKRFIWLNLTIIGLNILILPLSSGQDGAIAFLVMHFLIYSPFWLIKIYRTYDRYGRLMEHWPVKAEARLGTSN